MLLKFSILLCVFLVITRTEAFVKRDTTPPTPPNILDTFKDNMDQFRKCIDQSLAKAVGDVNEKQLQPVFSLVGDQLNRINKAFVDLTATKSPNTDDD